MAPQQDNNTRVRVKKEALDGHHDAFHESRLTHSRRRSRSIEQSPQRWESKKRIRSSSVSMEYYSDVSKFCSFSENERQQRLSNFPSSTNHRHRRKRRRRKRYSQSANPVPIKKERESESRGSPSSKRGIVSDDEELSPAQEIAGRTRSQKRSEKATSVGHDDSIGHFRGGPGTYIGERYRVVNEVGLGTFGRVLECFDLQSQRHRSHYRSRDSYVAVKIVRNVKRYYDSARIEATIIKDVNDRGGRGRSHCVVMNDAFTFQGHYCLVFERLGPSLYDFLKRHEYRPFPMICVQDFAVQLLETMEFIHSFRLVHTDLKLENILLMNGREVIYRHRRVPESTRIKLIDFGGACYDHTKKSSIINTRQYRAPEVIMGVGWSMPSDIWSLGCILVELYRGELLFPTHENYEHLALMERILGSFPWRFLNRATVFRDAFDSNGRHKLSRVLEDESATFVKRSKSLQAIVHPDHAWFLRLLRDMLCIDPEERATAHESLRFLASIRRDFVRCA